MKMLRRVLFIVVIAIVVEIFLILFHLRIVSVILIKLVGSHIRIIISLFLTRGYLMSFRSSVPSEKIWGLVQRTRSLIRVIFST